MNKFNKVFVTLSILAATCFADRGLAILAFSDNKWKSEDYCLVILALIMNAIWVALLTKWNSHLDSNNDISGNTVGGDLVVGNKTSVIK